MKKHLWILMILLTLTGWSQRFNGGILAGGLVSQVDGDANGGFHKVGYLGGAFVSLKISRRSSFQLEMEYIQKGARKSADSLNYGETFLNRIHYLEIPLLYQFTFAKRVQAEIGPAADVYLGSYNEVNGSESPYLTTPYRTITLTGIAGISCFITDHLKVGLRFNYSLIPSFTHPTQGARNIFWQWGQFNNVISLQLSWYFKER